MNAHELADLRRDKDEFFGQHHMSPLTEEQQAHFTGLRYYPDNAALRLVLAIETDVPHDIIVMQTSSGGEQAYRRYGRVTFEVEGQEVSLALYQPEMGGDLFLPFRDATSGNETYGGGRYLDLHPNNDGTIEIDFNLAYNPYCAYNDQWTCPLPPVENWLPVPVRAGEMAFDGHE